MKLKINKSYRSGFFLTIALILALTSVYAQDHHNKGNLKFIENKNQWETQILYKAEIGGGALFLEKNCFTFAFQDKKAVDKLMSYKHIPKANIPVLKPSDYLVKNHAYKINFLNSSPDVKVSADDSYKDYNNYFLGDDRAKWSSKVKSYKKVTYTGVYNGIDLKVYESDYHLKYDFEVDAGADVDQILLEYVGAEKVSIKKGNLIVKTSINEITELKPIAYQIIDGEKKNIECNFKLKKNKLSFEFPNGYYPKYELIIDPTLVFSTYSGSAADNWGFTATYDPHGNVYSGGVAFGTGYPVSVGAFQTIFGGGETGAYLAGCDVAIIKYDSSGTQRLYATYLGGSRNDLPHSMMVNTVGELVVFGTTGSSNFPVTANAFDLTFNGGDSMNYDFNSIKFSHGIDIFVFKLSEDGSQLNASTYIGGTKNDGLNDPSILSYNYADGARGEIMIDNNNNVYVVSTTNSLNFPTTIGSFQPTFGGGLQDGVVFKFDNNLSNLIWSSYLGGNNADAVYGIVLDKSNNLFVSGGTSSTNFPTTPGVLHPNYLGGITDGFITKINTNGNTILKSTYYGSSGYDQAYLIARDKPGNIYVYGQTTAPGTTLIYNAAWATPNSGQFISKMHPDLNSLVWSTVFGSGSGAPNISPTAFLVDYCNKIYLSGWGGPNINGFGGTNGLPVTGGAFQNTTDNNDYYFMVINDDASALVYGSYFGGMSYEHVDGGTSRFDRRGRIYQSVCAGCGGYDDFPTTPGAWSNTNNSTNCNNGVIKFDFNIPITIANFDPPPIGCAPYNAYFNNTSIFTNGTGISYIWNFGDASTSTQENPTHTYTSSGVYTVTLIAFDPNACNLSDTISQQIVILSDSSGTLPPKTICNGDFTQIGLIPLPDTSITYSWTPAIGLSDVNVSNPIATPNVTTTYTVLISNGLCTDTISQIVTVQNFSVNAGPDTTVCNGSVLLSAQTTGGANIFVWSTNPNLTDTINLSISNSTAIVNVLGTTTYYIYASNGACDGIDSVIVNVSNINISTNDVSICQGNSTNIGVVNLNPANPLTYSWTPTASIISGANTANPLVNPTVTTSFVVTALDSLGCQKLDTVIVSVVSVLPNYSVVPISCNGICDGQITLNPSGGAAPYSYNWNIGAVSPVISNLCPGTYSYTITENGGCKYSSSITITEPAPLNLVISDSNNVYCNGICDGWATVTVNGGTLPYSYSWINGQTTQTAINLCAGYYSLTVTDSHLCPNTIAVNITDTSNFAALIDTIIPPTCYGYCDGSAVVLANGGITPYTYLWDNGQTLNTVTLLCSGIHQVTIHEVSGCIRNVFATIPQPDEVVASVSNITPPTCFGFCNASVLVGTVGGTPGYTYSWSNGQNGPNATNLCTGNISVTITDSHNCPDTLDIVIPNTPQIIVTTQGSNIPCVEVCNGVATAFVSGGTLPFTYLWSNFQNTNPITNLCSGTYSCTITDANSCSSTTMAIIQDSVWYPNIVTTSADDTIYASQSTQLTTTIIPGASYTWTPPTGLNNPNISNPIASPMVTTSYVVNITDQFGCVYLDTVVIYVLDVNCDEPDIYVPNAFTPNGDLKNDILYVHGNVIQEIYFTIYDRWGEKVFETRNMRVGWDGTYKGKLCDPAVYVYYLDVTCINKEKHIQKGNITIIR